MASSFSSSGNFVYDPARGKFRSYLKTCTVRAAVKLHGANLRFRGIPLDQIPEPEQSVEPMWNDFWEEQRVAQALKLLRTSQENSSAFRAFEEYVLRDRAANVAAIKLGISENSIHQAKSRMTKMLRETVAKLRELEP
jgi:DNA-directed RNA polymerase specialized sigma24 family protein